MAFYDFDFAYIEVRSREAPGERHEGPIFVWVHRHHGKAGEKG